MNTSDDGTLEILIGSGSGRLSCINHTGGLEWQYTLGNLYALSSPTVADLDADGTFEILISSQTDLVCCLNHTGGLEWKNSIGGLWIGVSSPAVADLTGDGTLEVLIGSENGVLRSDLRRHALQERQGRPGSTRSSWKREGQCRGPR